MHETQLSTYSQWLQETYKPAILHGYMQLVVARNLHVLLILGFQSEINTAMRTCFTTGANPVGRQLGLYSRKWRHSPTCGDICLMVNAVMDLPQRSHGLTTLQSWTCQRCSRSTVIDLPQYSHRPVTVQVMGLPQCSHRLTTVQSWTCHSAATDLPQYSHRPVTVQP